MWSMISGLNRVNRALACAALWAITINSHAKGTQPPKAPVCTSPRILETKIFDQEHDGAARITFDVPKAGKAMLRLVNGARIEARIGERVTSANLSVNGKRVRPVTSESNIAETPVDLVRGSNVLEVHEIKAASGQRLAVCIDALPDAIDLEPLANAGVAGEPIPVRARVTALGLPVEGAVVRFEVLRGGVKVTARTGPSGGPRAGFMPRDTTGANGRCRRLTASPSRPP